MLSMVLLDATTAVISPVSTAGVAVLARKKLHQVQVFSSSKENSQLLVVAVAGLHVCAAYAPPDRGPALADLTSLAAEYFVSNPNHHAQPFLFAGDFNEEADDCQLVEFLAPYCGHVLASGRPTRWQGQRELDYFVTNRPHHLSSVVVELVQLSDHVPISVTWCPPTSESFKGILTQTPDFSIPSGLSSDIWRKTLSDSWTFNAEVSDFISNLPEIPDVQSEWDCFQALLNSVFRRAFSVVAENSDLPDTATTDAAHRLQRPGRKGVVARFKLRSFSGPIVAPNLTSLLFTFVINARGWLASPSSSVCICWESGLSLLFIVLFCTSSTSPILAFSTWSESWTNFITTSTMLPNSLSVVAWRLGVSA